MKTNIISCVQISKIRTIPEVDKCALKETYTYCDWHVERCILFEERFGIVYVNIAILICIIATIEAIKMKDFCSHFS